MRRTGKPVPEVVPETVLLPVYLLTDCRDLVEHLAHLSVTLTEKRLIGDFLALAEALQTSTVQGVFWLRREVTVADEEGQAVDVRSVVRLFLDFVNVQERSIRDRVWHRSREFGAEAASADAPDWHARRAASSESSRGRAPSSAAASHSSAARPCAAAR